MNVNAERLRLHVETLAATPRPAMSDALAAARRYVSGELQQSGWEVQSHPFSIGEAQGLAGNNLIATHSAHPVGSRPRFCIGAHLDSRPETPGADDNASAVAVLLEIARQLPSCWPASAALELELVVFDLEEWGMLGGAEHAGVCSEAHIDLRGMISLEMLGYCSHEPGSQQMPPELEGKYPNTGNFIGLVGNQNSRPLIRAMQEGMTRVSDLPVQCLIVMDDGEDLPATRLSDHSPFWDAGYPALMMTDTSFLRNPHYHRPSDTPDTLDYEFLERVFRGTRSGVIHLLETGLPRGESTAAGH